MKAGVVLFIFAAIIFPCFARNVSTYEFLSRPDIVPPVFNVVSIDPATVSDGFIFVSPKSPEHTNFTRTVYMYNNGGSLVWSGHALNQHGYQMTVFYRCDYEDAPHLCLTLYNGPRSGGEADGSFSMILNDEYLPVRTLAPSYELDGKKLTMDMHEFRLVDNGTSALLSSHIIVQPKSPVRFKDCPGLPSVTYLKDAFFTEVSTDGTNETLFSWNALDHIDPSEALLCPGDVNAGSGKSYKEPMDFFHINSIDKNQDGDYLVSARHTSTIYKIAGKNSPSGKQPGSIIWYLGGKRNDFNLLSRTTPLSKLEFSFQHYAHFTGNGIRFWDNADSEAAEAESVKSIHPSAKSSSGKDVELDEKNHTATLIYQTVPPSKALGHSQGSHQLLPNGNHLCGLGSFNEVFERTQSGALALDGYFAQRPIGSYRAAKYEWKGNPPLSELALFTYAQSHSSSTVYYVSWNGATAVHEYRFYSSNFSSDNFVETVRALKDYSFETIAESRYFGMYSYAEALDAKGAVLGRTPTVKSFVPAPELAASCNQRKCAPYTDYTVAPQDVLSVQVKYVNTE